MYKVNAGKGTFRGTYCTSLVTPNGFALEARCKRLKAALKANLMSHSKISSN